MAAFGAKYPRFAPNKTVSPEGVVTYDEPVTIGALNKADLTVTMASGKVYGDNELQESIDEFVSGSIAMETTDMENTVMEDSTPMVCTSKSWSRSIRGLMMTPPPIPVREPTVVAPMAMRK